eukprot:403368790
MDLRLFNENSSKNHNTVLRLYNIKYSIILFSILLLSQFLIKTQQQNSFGYTTFDGVSEDQLPSYYILDGTNGMILPLSSRTINSNLDYYLRIWLRPKSSYDQKNNDKSEQIFEFPGSLRCSFIYNSTLSCNSINNQQTTSSLGTIQTRNQQVNLNITGLDPNNWVCLTLGAQYLSNLTFIRLDYQDKEFRGVNASYLGLFQNQTTKWNMTIGRNVSIPLISSNNQGFNGDLRELYTKTSFVNYTQAGILRSQMCTWDDTTLADYRLQRGNLNDSIRHNSTGILQQLPNTQSLPIWNYDFTANDMCYPFFNTANIIKFSGNNSQIINGNLDSRMSLTTANYQYTSSFWIKTQPGIITNATFNQSLAFLTLQNVFSLWFTDPNNIRLFINSTNSPQIRYSADNFVPMNQWANIQFIIDRSTNHTEMRVYDLQRRLISIQSQSNTLGPQAPLRNFTLFQNFVGYFKFLIIYQSRQVLPITHPVGASATLTENTLILYYKFDFDNYSNKTLKALNLNSANATGLAMNFTQEPQFETVQWEENLSYVSRSVLGTTNQNVNLFDGMTCNDQSLIYNFTSRQSQITYGFELENDMNEGTVELWFRRQQINQTQQTYIISLKSLADKKEYFSIKQKSNEQNMRCKISDLSLDLEIPAVNQIRSWVHIACKFTNKFDLSALYQIQGETSDTLTKDIDQDQMIPKGSYIAILGNSIDFTSGSVNTQIKELRLWKEYRTDLSIIQTRYIQLGKNYQSASLLIYARLASGDPYPQNLIGLRKPISTQGLDLVTQTDKLMQVCPFNTFLNNNNQSCMRNAFLNHSLLILPQIQNNTVSFLVTSNYSDMYQHTQSKGFSYAWMNQTSYQIPQNQANQETINLTLSQLTSMQNLNPLANWTQKVQGQYNTFSQSQQIALQMQNCTIAVDNKTNSSQSYQFIEAIQGQSDINLTIQILKFSDCGMYRNVSVMKNLSLTAFPQRQNIQNLVQSYDDQTHRFNLTLTKDEQQKFTTDLDVNIIVQVGFNISDNSTGQNVTSLAYQNLVYSVKFVSKITPSIRLSQHDSNNILLGETIRLLANDSFQTVGGSNSIKNGLSYAWSCPQIFKQLCQQKLNDRYLEITSNETQKYGVQFDVPYQFNVTVWKSSHSNSFYNKTTSVEIQWQNILRPDFVIQPMTNTGPQISKENQINVILKNYNIDAENLKFEIIIRPQIQVYTFYMTKSQIYLQVPKFEFAQNTQYNITLVASLIKYPQVSKSQSLIFQTGQQVINQGSLQILPTNIISLSTLATISFTGYKTGDQFITYNVYGIVQLINQTQQEKVLLNRYPLNQDQTFETVLSKYQQIQCQIINKDGQFEMQNYTQVISQIEGFNLVNWILSATLESSINMTQQLMKLRQAAYVLYQNDTAHQSVQIQAKTNIIQFIQTAITSLTKQSINVSEQQPMLSFIVEIIQVITNNASIVNDDLISQAMTALKQLSQFSYSLKQLSTNSDEFFSNYLQAVSNVQNYIKVYKSNIVYNVTAKSQRLLQSTINQDTEIYSLLIESQKILNTTADSYCQNIALVEDYQVQNRISSSLNSLIIEKIPAYQFVQNRTFISQNQDASISMPYKLLIDQEQKLSTNRTNNVCYTVQSNYINNLMSLNFTNQTIETNKPVIQVSSVNDLGVNIIQKNGLQMGQSNVFNISYQYQFNDTTLNFRNNQTVCLTIDSDIFYSDYKNTNWSYKTCETKYDFDNDIINCYCNQLGAFYYAIGTDYSRIYIPPEKSLLDYLLQLLSQFDTSIIAILFFMIFMLVVMPAIAIWRDMKDYQLIQNGEFNISDEILKQIAAKKQKPYDAVVYNKQRYEKYLQIESLSFMTLFKIFLSELHPFFSIFTRFDFELKRTIRLMFIIYQVGLVAIICGLAFGTTYRNDEREFEEREVGYDSTDQSNGVLAGFIIAVLCLPTMSKFTNCFKSKIQYDPSEETSHSHRSKSNVNSDSQNDNDIKRQKNKAKQNIMKTPPTGKTGAEDFDNIADIEDGKTQHTQQRFKDQMSSGKGNRSFSYKEENSVTNIELSRIEKGDESVVLSDKCAFLKILMLILCFAWTILSMLTVSLESGANPKAHSETMVIAFYVAILIGFLLYDFIHLVLVTILTPGIVQEENEYEGELGFMNKLFSCLIVPDQAKEIMRDIILVYNMNTQQQAKQVKQVQSQQQKNTKPQNNKSADQVPQSQTGKAQFRMPNQGSTQQKKQLKNDIKPVIDSLEPDDNLSSDQGGDISGPTERYIDDIHSRRPVKQQQQNFNSKKNKNRYEEDSEYDKQMEQELDQM